MCFSSFRVFMLQGHVSPVETEDKGRRMAGIKMEGGENLPGTERAMMWREMATGKRWRERMRDSVLVLGQLCALESARYLVGKHARWQCARDEKERRKVGRWDRKCFCVLFFYHLSGLFYICAKLSRRKRFFHLRLRVGGSCNILVSDFLSFIFFFASFCFHLSVVFSNRC